ncbi:MAG: SDR family NAD(P)-dependent oxidoreductase [Gemmatimonadetes bacterium]|nr:SDR family NAD(P)-dependent oxidoreductase [Gemmatimonadota bacterium]
MAERRVALVTGGARRLGAAFSRVLARRGYVVAIHHRQSHAEAAALGAEIASAGGESHTFAADLADPRRLPRWCVTSLNAADGWTSS